MCVCVYKYIASAQGAGYFKPQTMAFQKSPDASNTTRKNPSLLEIGALCLDSEIIFGFTSHLLRRKTRVRGSCRGPGGGRGPAHGKGVANLAVRSFGRRCRAGFSTTNSPGGSAERGNRAAGPLLGLPPGHRGTFCDPAFRRGALAPRPAISSRVLYLLRKGDCSAP